MELVDGDAESPTLISNVEVMELLRKNLETRAQTAKKTKKTNKRNNKQFRHRDWVEEEVHRYLRSTPCVNLDPRRRQEFHAILKSHKKVCQAAAIAISGDHDESAVKLEDEEMQRRQSVPTGFGLTEAETLQIMNMMPTKPVEIHLMVDELQSRMTETRQEEFLAFIASYCKQPGVCGNSEEGSFPTGAVMDEDTALQPNTANKHDVSEAVTGKWLKNGNRNNGTQQPQPSAVNVKQEETDGEDPQTGLL
jgi:RNA polymerase Rpb4